MSLSKSETTAATICVADFGLDDSSWLRNLDEPQPPNCFRAWAIPSSSLSIVVSNSLRASA